jgi:Tfp pilus assembly protein PilW
MELIVSLALFSIVLIVVLGLFSMGITAQRKVLALQGVQENARFILEFMAKEIRMGTVSAYDSSRLIIVRPDGENVTYAFAENDIIRASNTSNGPINSENTIVTGGFYVYGVGAADGLQPKVTISLSVRGSGTKIEEQARIDLQTTLSQRILDIP